MANKRKKVDFDLASEVFNDASLADSFPKNANSKTLIEVSKLEANPFQPRLDMNEANIIELSQSILENGLLQPITVMKSDNDQFTIVFGHRRAAAHAYLDKEYIEANIINIEDDKQLAITPMVENLQRKDMQPIETAIGLNKILKMNIVSSQDDLSKSIGISQGRISKLLSLLKLSPFVLEAIKKLKYRDVTVLSALNKIDLDKQESVFKAISSLTRADALLKIKNLSVKKNISSQRVIHSNTTIKINTKGISAQKKEQVMIHLAQIEELLKAE